MKSFFKSYLLTVLIICIVIGLFFSISLRSLVLDATDGSPSFLQAILALIASFLAFYLVLMVVVALPFFALVRKGGSFNWVAAILMGLLVHIAFFLIGLGTTNIYGVAQLIVLSVVGVIFGSIFSLFYKRFQKREKPKAEEIQEIFN